MRGVSVLEYSEAVRLDQAKVGALYRDLGPVPAENVICRAMEEIALRLHGLAEPHASGQWAELARRAKSLGAIAEQIGMTALKRVAGDVAACAMRGDAASLGATLERLDRIAHRSLAAVWDMQDIGG